MPNVFTSTHVAFIFYDSMSRLEALNEVKFELDLVQKITKDYTHLTNNGKTISFCWISSHVNISGNEKADAAAKSALSFPITKMKLPAYDLIPCVFKFCFEEWQDIWNCCRAINFTLSTQLWVLLNTIKFALAVRR